MLARQLIDTAKATLSSQELAQQSFKHGRMLPALGVIATTVCAILFSPSAGHAHFSEWTIITISIYIITYFFVFSKNAAPTPRKTKLWHIKHIATLMLIAISWSALSVLTIHHIEKWEEIAYILIIFALISIPIPSFIYSPLVTAANPSTIFLTAIVIFYIDSTGEPSNLLLVSALLVGGTIHIIKNIELSISTANKILLEESSLSPIVRPDSLEKTLYDTVTGLNNRNGLIKIFESKKQKKSKCLFSSIKLVEAEELYTTTGNSEANLVLGELAKLIDRHLSPYFICGHDGLGQFMALAFFERSSIQQEKEAVETLSTLQGVLDQNFGELRYTVSIGISKYPDDCDDPEKLFMYAISAMNSKSDNNGRNVHFFEKKTKITKEKHKNMRSSLPDALRKNEFRLYLQPKLSLTSGKTTGAEALIRWHSESFGLVSPADFIPIAESSGYIKKIGIWVLKESHRILENPELPENFSIAVNISALQLEDDNLLKEIDRINKKLIPINKSIELEITESLFLSNAQSTMNFISKIENMGIEISLDDFGTGYSSLSYLKNFSAHKLKLDMSFIDEIPDNTKHSALVRSVIALTKSLDMKIVAEGIERKEQFAWLQREGCDEGQGYLIGKPMPEDLFISWLKERVE